MMQKQLDGVIRLVQDIYATRDDEIQCDTASELMVLCADGVLADHEARQQYPALFRHFRFCPDCAAEYNMLMELAQLEANDQLSQPITAPPLPREKPSGSLLSQAAEIVHRLRFPGFLAGAASVAVRGATASAPVKVDLRGSDLTLEIVKRRSSIHPDLWVLQCTVKTTIADVTAQWEGSPIRLQSEASGALEEVLMLDALGEVIFDQVEPGRYMLYFRLLDQAYTVEGIELS